MRLAVEPGRTAYRMACVGAAVLVAGLVPGPASSAAPGGGLSRELRFDCGAPEGQRQVAVTVAVRLPGSAAPRQPVRPDAVAVSALLSAEDRAALLPGLGPNVLSTAALTVEVGQNGDSAKADWERLVSDPTANPAGGDMELVHRGPVPTVTVGRPGALTFAAERLTLKVSSPDASGGESGGEISCTVHPGQDTILGTVTVAGDTAPADPGPSGTPEPPGRAPRDPDGIDVSRPDGAAGEDPCPPGTPTGELDVSEAPPVPPGADPRVTNLPGTPGCAYAVGYANVAKLGSAMLVNDPKAQPRLIKVLANKRITSRAPSLPGGSYIRIDSLGSLSLPDATSAFLAFGFQPVSAKVRFDNGPLTISTGDVGIPKKPFAVATFWQSLHVYDVRVNGTPLDVGPGCGTARPFKVVLHGAFPEYGNVFTGGPLRGEASIPEFSGCANGDEVLNPLFTASLSGPGNHLELMQGTTCVPANPTTPCPPSMPELPKSRR